jgi:hypothetical protein
MRGYLFISVLIVFLLMICIPTIAKEINVTIAAKAERTGAGGLRVVGETTLPNKASLMITVRNTQNGYSAQTKTTVDDGHFTAGEFTDRGNPIPNGMYEIEIVTPMLGLQSDEIREAFGENGQNLSGDIVVEKYGQKTVRYKITQEITGGPASAQKDESEQTDQEKRLSLINQMIADGILIKVEKPADLPRAFVGRGFYALTFDDKQAIVSIVLAYFLEQDPQANILILRDGYTNKEIGTFGKYGLQLD